MITDMRTTKPNNHDNTTMEQYKDTLSDVKLLTLLASGISESSIILLLLYNMCVNNIPSSNAGYDPKTISKSFVHNK